MKLSEIRKAVETMSQLPPSEFFGYDEHGALQTVCAALPALLRAIDGIDEEFMCAGDVADLLEWAGIEVDE